MTVGKPEYRIEFRYVPIRRAWFVYGSSFRSVERARRRLAELRDKETDPEIRYRIVKVQEMS